MQTLHRDFYERGDVALIARELIGKIIITQFEGETTAARIVETEAYAGVIDRASHAYGNRHTPRTRVMYGRGGTAYVYLCYGIHYMFNVVTNRCQIPEAVLIRGAAPLDITPIIMSRFDATSPHPKFGRGPGNVAKLLGFHTKHSGMDLTGPEVCIISDAYEVPLLACSPRIGVDYAGSHARWLYRFFLPGHPQVTPHPFNKEPLLLRQ